MLVYHIDLAPFLTDAIGAAAIVAAIVTFLKLALEVKVLPANSSYHDWTIRLLSGVVGALFYAFVTWQVRGGVSTGTIGQAVVAGVVLGGLAIGYYHVLTLQRSTDTAGRKPVPTGTPTVQPISLTQASPDSSPSAGVPPPQGGGPSSM